MILHRRASILLSTLALPIVLTLAGCSALKSIVISPASGSVVLTAVGQTAQYTALGTSQQGSATPTTSPVTVNWSVSNPNVATISSTAPRHRGWRRSHRDFGRVGWHHRDFRTSRSTFQPPRREPPAACIASIAVIPGAQSVASPGQTSQYLAASHRHHIIRLDRQPDEPGRMLSSSSTQIGTIGATSGLATAVGQGTTTITALYSSTVNNSVLAATASFTVSGGTTEKYTAVTITPGAESLSASGQTVHVSSSRSQPPAAPGCKPM